MNKSRHPLVVAILLLVMGSLTVPVQVHSQQIQSSVLALGVNLPSQTSVTVLIESERNLKEDDVLLLHDMERLQQSQARSLSSIQKQQNSTTWQCCPLSPRLRDPDL